MKTAKMISNLAGLLLMLAAPASWGVVVELVDPPAIAIPSGYSDSATAKSIKFAIQERKWQILSEAPGEITAELVVRGRHHVKVSVLYDERYVRIRYLDSSNMYYQMGVPDNDDVDEWSDTAYKKVPLIHHHYNGWVQALANSIKRALHTPALSP